MHIVPGVGVCTMAAEDKWKKMKLIVEKWHDRLCLGKTELCHKELLSDQGFLVYATWPYSVMIPHLKGFHLSVENWCGNRDNEGWKLPAEKVYGPPPPPVFAKDLDDDVSYLADDEEIEAKHLEKRRLSKEVIYAPASGATLAAPRFKDDLRALMLLTAERIPPLRVVRPSRRIEVFYGFGDAAGAGFGSTVKGDDGTTLRVGVWGKDAEDESSNFKELTNLVETTEEEVASGRLKNAEFFIFTDNSTAESCFYKGSSTSKLLHALVLRLRSLELKYGLTIHMVHVSGKRMIAQGTDGCSRGLLLEGVMAGKDMLSYIDLAHDAFTRFPPLLDWVRTWTGKPHLKPLTCEEWFVEGHGIVGGSPDKRGVWIPKHGPAGEMMLWSPPPVIADVALEEILKARHKRTDTYHVVVIPRLFTPKWRRLFYKACDFTFLLNPGSSHWPDNMFEPVWIGILLPFTHHRPWCLRDTPLLVEMGRDLRRLLQESEASAGNLLRKLLRIPARLAPLQPSVARGVLHMPREERISNVPGERWRGKSVA